MHILLIYLIFSMLAVMWFDATTYRIPNWLVASLLLLYPLAVYFGHGAVHWQPALLAMGIVFALGYVVFALKWMGAGDIKLITACALWVGLKHLADFIFAMASRSSARKSSSPASSTWTYARVPVACT